MALQLCLFFFSLLAIYSWSPYKFVSLFFCNVSWNSPPRVFFVCRALLCCSIHFRWGNNVRATSIDKNWTNNYSWFYLALFFFFIQANYLDKTLTSMATRLWQNLHTWTDTPATVFRLCSYNIPLLFVCVRSILEMYLKK